ncbi:hypothetical protein HBA55_34620 [Pseudomaricurvus alkylphenolicus]|uniref:hypothetical protein n=1 Tax=Pseudomaricurvus alkylphenolicus TaxID=1306991 RepID=UPI0014216794|nr:hypothetical protein [Pseudomaricurvus alkylphenolicus]NIB44766.1 hypothetical protein [Pseudomaricurvus alkylphenolicus]
MIDVYARVAGDQVLEWPVFESHIRNRGLPLSLFVKVQPSPLPVVFSLVEVLEETKPALVSGQWVQQWATVPRESDAIREEAADKINTKVNRAIESLKAGYPVQEVETWTLQKLEADAWTLDNSAPVPTLTGIAARRGVGVDVVVAKVRAKSDLYQGTLGLILGNRQAAEDQLDALLALEERPEDFADQVSAIVNGLTTDWPDAIKRV